MIIVISAFSFSTFSFRHNKNRASIVGTLQNSPRAAHTTMSPTPPLPEECVKHPGYGYCFQQCICTCYDVVPSTDPEKDDDEVLHETCVCGHRTHDIDANVCPTSGCGTCNMESCAPCGGLAPKWCFDIHFGTCSANCAILSPEQMGPMSPSGIGECPICFETKPLHKLEVCGHEFCAPCRGECTDVYSHPWADNRCSLCRQENVCGEERAWGLGRA